MTAKKYLIEFSGEHPLLPLEELKGAAEACGEEIRGWEGDGRLWTVDSEGIECAVKRCAMLHLVALKCASPVVREDAPEGFTPSIRELKERGREIEAFIKSHFPGARTYRLNLRKTGGRFPGVDGDAIIRGLAAGIDMKVSLQNPDLEVVVFVTPWLYFGILLHENSRAEFRKRAVKNRPFFSPISLHPVLARALVNLSRVGHRGVILDPFCGTGGILIEASLLGLSAVGADRDSEMLRGAEMNLRHFSAEALLLDTDVGALPDILREHGITIVDGIATDLPYGRASTTFGEDKSELYTRAFETFKAVLKPGGYTAVVSPGPLPGIDGLRVVSSYNLRVHRSLTRYFTVYRRL